MSRDTGFHFKCHASYVIHCSFYYFTDIFKGHLWSMDVLKTGHFAMHFTLLELSLQRLVMAMLLQRHLVERFFKFFCNFKIVDLDVLRRVRIDRSSIFLLLNENYGAYTLCFCQTGMFQTSVRRSLKVRTSCHSNVPSSFFECRFIENVRIYSISSNNGTMAILLMIGM